MEFINGFSNDSLLIVDEVHGIGSLKQSLGLNSNFNYRLGLSATPERWFDVQGTQLLYEYFGNVIFRFDIVDALENINPETGESYLTPYYYNPIIIDLERTELKEYYEFTKKIAYYFSTDDEEDRKKAESYLLKRQLIINNAVNKLIAFEKILDDNPNIDKTLIFCSPQQISKVQKILNSKGITQHKFTQTESASKSKKQMLSQREQLIKLFEEDYYKCLVAIKCLDEGVDIPAAKTAIILSSTSNPREYIQRRGRILRRSPGKKYAVIYDMIVFPKDRSYSKISDKEVDRYRDFASNAVNSYECLKILDKYYYG